MTRHIHALRTWPARRWGVAAAAGLAYTLAIGLPTALIPNPVFGREIPPTWWSWPALVASAVLAGLLAATFVRTGDQTSGTRGGMAGGLLTFFAVGCPVCNKLVLLALGSAGAITWFEPVQPFLQLAAVGLLGWALHVRLTNEVACALPDPVGVGS